MARHIDRAYRAYELFKSHAGLTVKLEIVSDEIGWQPSTLKTYLNKNYWHNYVKYDKKSQTIYIETAFSELTFKQFQKIHSQVKPFRND